MALNSGDRALALTSLETTMRLGDDSAANKQVAAALHMERGSIARAVELLKSAPAADLDFQFIDQALAWLNYENEWDYFRDLLTAANARRNLLDNLQGSRLLTHVSTLQLHDGNRGWQSQRCNKPSSSTRRTPKLHHAGQAYRDERDLNRAEPGVPTGERFDLYRENALVSLAQIAIDQQNFERALEAAARRRELQSRAHDLQRNVDVLRIWYSKDNEGVTARMKLRAPLFLFARVTAFAAQGAEIEPTITPRTPTGCCHPRSRRGRAAFLPAVGLEQCPQQIMPEGIAEVGEQSLIIELKPLLAAGNYEAALARIGLNYGPELLLLERGDYDAFMGTRTPTDGSSGLLPIMREDAVGRATASVPSRQTKPRQRKDNRPAPADRPTERTATNEAASTRDNRPAPARSAFGGRPGGGTTRQQHAATGHDQREHAVRHRPHVFFVAAVSRRRNGLQTRAPSGSQIYARTSRSGCSIF